MSCNYITGPNFSIMSRQEHAIGPSKYDEKGQTRFVIKVGTTEIDLSWVCYNEHGLFFNFDMTKLD